MTLCPTCKNEPDTAIHEHGCASGISPWTRHGHRIDIPDTGAFPQPATRARCGGPGLCKECSVQAQFTIRQYNVMSSLTPRAPEPEPELEIPWRDEELLASLTRFAVDNVLCTRCDAAPSWQCTNKNGELRKPHQKRLEPIRMYTADIWLNGYMHGSKENR